MAKPLNVAQRVALSCLDGEYDSVRVQNKPDLAVCIKDGECYHVQLLRDGSVSVVHKASIQTQ